MHSYIYLTSTISISIAAIIIWLIRRDRLHIKYSLWWFLIAIATVILGIFPQIVDKIASQLNIGYPPILAIVIALGIILLKMLLIDIESSRYQKKIIRLTQKVAILEQELEQQLKQKK